MQIILTRDHANIPWGFRLKGGAEYNVPLSILKVNEGSPSQYKLECGDVIQTIGNYPALNLKHEEALNLIRLFDLTLPLIIQRPQMHNQFQTMNSMNSTMNRMAPVSMNKQPVTWRPPSQISSQPSSINQQYQPPNQQYQQPSQQYQQPSQQYQPPSQQYQQQSQYQQPSQHFTNQYQPIPTQVSPGYQYHPPSSASNPQQRNSTSSTFSTASPIHATSNFFNQAAASPTPYEYQQSPFSVGGSSNSNPNSLLMMNTNTNTSAYHQPSSYQGQYQHTGPTSPISVMPVSSPPPAPQLPISVSPSGPPPPPAPPLPVSFNSVNNYRANQGATSSSSHTSHTSTSETRTSSTSGAIPDALLKALNASPMGKKPFTYTPGGLDLSHVRQSARVRRYESMNSGDRMMPNQPNQGLSVGGGGPQPPHHHSQQSFSNNYQSYQKQSTSQTNLSTSGIGGGVGGVGGMVHAPSAISTHQRLNSASMNSFETTSQPSVVSAGPPRLQRQASGGGGSPMGFSVTPEQLARSRNIIKQDEPGKDLHNQSFSFKMLNKWIAESESQPVQLRSKKDEEEEQQKQVQQAAIKRSEVIKAIEEEEKRGFHVRNSQSPQTATRMNVVPSKAFQFVDRKFNESADAGNNLTMRRDSYNGDDYSYTGTGKPPARERDQEDQPQKYRGTHIPSKTFKYLQYLTQNELVTDEKPQVPTNNNPETQTLSQAEQQASSLRTNTLQYQSPPELLESRQQSNSNRISSMNNNEPSYTQPNLNQTHESDNLNAASEPAFKSLGVKSMMNRFNNLSSSSNTNSSSFPAQLGSTYFQNQNTSQSQQINQAAFNSTASSFAHQPMNLSNNRQINTNAFSTTSEFIESQIASSSTLPQYNESDSKAAHVDEKVDFEKPLDSDRIDETISEKQEIVNVSAFEENVVLPAAKLEISETLHTEEIEITATNDLNAATTTHLSNHSEETNILTLSSNNELIDTNINLNESTKNEQQQQQKEEAAESVENNPNKSEELKQATTEVVQETQVEVQAETESKNIENETNSAENVESNTLNNETKETTQSQVIETSEF